MSARAVAILVAALCALAPGGVGADSPRVVSLEECTSMALAHDPGLRSDVLESAAAEARLSEMKGQYVPSVSVQAGYSRLSDVEPGSLTIPGVPVPVTFPSSPVNSTIVKLSVAQPLFTGLRISSSIRQAEASRTAAGSDVQRTRAEVRYLAQAAFWQLARARSLEAAAREAQSQLERRLADLKTRFDQGVATSNDVLQAGTRLEDARIATTQAAGARELARIQLAQLIGIPPSQAFDVPDVPPGPSPDPAPGPGTGMDELVSRALAARPELGSARSRITAMEAAADVARAGRFPTVMLTGDYTLANPNQRVFPQQDAFTGTWSVGIVASFDVGRYPQVAAQEQQAADRTSQAREALQRQSDAVAADVMRAAVTLNTALAVYESLKAETSQADENARYVEERFGQGVALPSARLDAQSMLAVARLRELAGLADCYIARAGLDRAQGD